MKRTIALLASAAVAAATPAVALAATAGEAAAPTQTIAQIAAGNPNFSTLVSLLKKVGLVKVLNGTTDYTVFAPTNAAFAAVPAATLKALAADKTELKAVLLYHVIPGSLPASEVVKHKTLHHRRGRGADDHRQGHGRLRQQGAGDPGQHPRDQRLHPRHQRGAHPAEQVAGRI